MQKLDVKESVWVHCNAWHLKENIGNNKHIRNLLRQLKSMGCQDPRVHNFKAKEEWVFFWGWLYPIC